MSAKRLTMKRSARTSAGTSLTIFFSAAQLSALERMAKTGYYGATGTAEEAATELVSRAIREEVVGAMRVLGPRADVDSVFMQPAIKFQRR